MFEKFGPPRAIQDVMSDRHVTFELLATVPRPKNAARGTCKKNLLKKARQLRERQQIDRALE